MPVRIRPGFLACLQHGIMEVRADIGLGDWDPYGKIKKCGGAEMSSETCGNSRRIVKPEFTRQSGPGKYVNSSASTILKDHRP